MVFKNVKHVLNWFYDPYRGYPGSIDLARLQVDKSINLENTELECLAFVGYQIANCFEKYSFEKQFILERSYRFNLSDQEIGNFLNWEQKVKNWNSTGIRKKRYEAEGELRDKLIEIEIIIVEPKL